MEGALVCATVEGAGSLIWPPGVPADPRRRLRLRRGWSARREDALIDAPVPGSADQGARLTQCLLPPEEQSLAVAAAAERLRRHYRSAVSGTRARPARLGWSEPARLTFEPYRAEHPEEFHATLERTYEGTLDCPEVNGVRSIDEVIRGHRVQGKYDPSRWWLARHDGEPAGVLLLIEQGEGEYDVAYMGLVPSCRRRGLGGEILLHALAEAKAAGTGASPSASMNATRRRSGCISPSVSASSTGAPFSLQVWR